MQKEVLVVDRVAKFGIIGLVSCFMGLWCNVSDSLLLFLVDWNVQELLIDGVMDLFLCYFLLLWCFYSTIKEPLCLLAEQWLSVSWVYEWSIILNLAMRCWNDLFAWYTVLISLQTKLLGSLSDENILVLNVVQNALDSRIEAFVRRFAIESWLILVLILP